MTKNYFRLFVCSLLVLLGATQSGWAFSDFAVQLTAAPFSENTSTTSFNVSVDGSNVSIVDADAKGTFSFTSVRWNDADHGWVNCVFTIPVDGPVKIELGDCQFGGQNGTIVDGSSNSTDIKANAPKTCWHNTKSVTTAYYTGTSATTLTVTYNGYCPYIAVTAIDVADIPNEATLTFSTTGTAAVGTVPTANKVKVGEQVTIPANTTLYVEGKTLTGWTDGTSTYAAGDNVTVNEDITLTPVFTDNAVSFADRTDETTVTWQFGEGNGVGPINAEGKSTIVVTQVNIGEAKIDVKMDVDASSGKLNNVGRGDKWAQCNDGTKMTIPAYKGMTISFDSNGDGASTTIAGTTTTDKTGTYNGTDATIDIVAGGMGYIASLTAVYPVATSETGGDDNPASASYDNVNATVAWAIGNENAATSISDAVANAVQETKVKVGSDLSVATYDATSNGGSTLPIYKPTTANPGCVATDMIEYTVKMKKGVTFTPSSFEFDAVKKGTDGAYFSWSYTIDGKESEITAYSNPKTQILRDNNANSGVSLTHKESVNVKEGGRVVTLRFYISNVASDKQMAIGNIKINGVVDGEEEVRSFTDFKVNFRTDPYTVVVPETGVLPEGVSIAGAFHDDQHGNGATTIKVPVDGPVKFTIGSCQYGGATLTIKNKSGEVLATMSSNKGCDNKTDYDHFVTWTYNVEAKDTLEFYENGYLPWFQAEACEYIESCHIIYYDVDGKTVLDEEDVLGGSDLVYKEGVAEKVTVQDGYKFRGWFNSTLTSATKIAEGTGITEDLKLYAKTSEIEDPTSTSRYDYDMTKTNWYLEDHEAIDITSGGKYYNSHGWLLGANDTIYVKVAGNAIISITNCCYSKTQTGTVTDAAGNQVGTFDVTNIGDGGADGQSASVRYEGEATTLAINWPQGAYVHGISVWNVKEFVTYDEATGYYYVPAGDGNSFLLALADANGREGAKIFLPNGTYDLGEQALTAVSGKNISIIGESMEGTIIKNAPPIEKEGIGTTATLLNTADGLYMQDLTIQNALDYYATGAAGRAVCLQDKGKNTVCKNVKMLSYQDTYYSNAKSNRYWEDSEIHGTVDYLCGDGNVVYQGCHFVNESRAKDKASGSDVLCAPNCTASDATYTNYGYVFLDCSVESNCKDFTLARSWGGESKAYFVNLKVLDNSLASSRWTEQGMNVTASAFKEYNTTNSEGNVTTPSSKEVTFYLLDSNKKVIESSKVTLETVMSAEEADALTIENIFPGWDPRLQTAQAEVSSVVLDGNTLKWDGTSEAYAICYNGSVVAIVTDNTYEVEASAGAKSAGLNANAADGWSVRAANIRGGFSPAVEATQADAVSEVKAKEVVKASNGKIYNVAGQEVSAFYKGIKIQNGKKFAE